MSNPLEMIKEGLQSGNLQQIADGYAQMTGQKISVPSSTVVAPPTISIPGVGVYTITGEVAPANTPTVHTGHTAQAIASRPYSQPAISDTPDYVTVKTPKNNAPTMQIWEGQTEPVDPKEEAIREKLNPTPRTRDEYVPNFVKCSNSSCHELVDANKPGGKVIIDGSSNPVFYCNKHV